MTIITRTTPDTVGQAFRFTEDYNNIYGFGGAIAKDTVGVLQQDGYLVVPGRRPVSVNYGLPLEQLDAPEAAAVLDRLPAQSYLRADPQYIMGADPEVLVMNGKEVLPAWEFLKKQRVPPIQYAYGGYNGGLWETFSDGFQAEWTFSPASCIQIFASRIRTGLRQVLAAARTKEPNAELTTACVVSIPKKQMDATSDENAELGCAPSMSIYDTMPIGLRGRELALRFAGFHLHFGLSGQIDPAAIVGALDELCALPSVAILAGAEDKRRRLFYGRAGEYRLPEHGLEYRTLSSTALAHPALVHLFMELARAAVNIAIHSKGKRIWPNVSQEEVRGIINSGDVDAARQVIKEHNTVIRDILFTAYGKRNGRVGKALRLMKEGANNLIDMNNLKDNWCLDVGGWGDLGLGGPGAQMSNLVLPKRTRAVPA